MKRNSCCWQSSTTGGTVGIGENCSGTASSLKCSLFFLYLLCGLDSI